MRAFDACAATREAARYEHRRGFDCRDVSALLTWTPAPLPAPLPSVVSRIPAKVLSRGGIVASGNQRSATRGTARIETLKFPGIRGIKRARRFTDIPIINGIKTRPLPAAHFAVRDEFY